MAIAKKTPAKKPPVKASPAKALTPAVRSKRVAATPATVKVAPVAQPAAKVLSKPKAEKPLKVKKPKLVRDSFTIPKVEYTVLEELKQRASQSGNPAKKSELLRAGIKALAAMPDAAFLVALKAVPAIKTGRPAKSA
jgi:hypothetical protein